MPGDRPVHQEREVEGARRRATTQQQHHRPFLYKKEQEEYCQSYKTTFIRSQLHVSAQSVRNRLHEGSIYLGYPQIYPVLIGQHHAFHPPLAFALFSPHLTTDYKPQMCFIKCPNLQWLKQIFHSTCLLNTNTCKPTNFLELNSKKTEPVVVAPEAQLQKVAGCWLILSHLSIKVCSLGISHTPSLNLQSHINCNSPPFSSKTTPNPTATESSQDSSEQAPACLQRCK